MEPNLENQDPSAQNQPISTDSENTAESSISASEIVVTAETIVTQSVTIEPVTTESISLDSIATETVTTETVAATSIAPLDPPAAETQNTASEAVAAEVAAVEVAAAEVAAVEAPAVEAPAVEAPVENALTAVDTTESETAIVECEEVAQADASESTAPAEEESDVKDNVGVTEAVAVQEPPVIDKPDNEGSATTPVAAEACETPKTETSLDAEIDAPKPVESGFKKLNLRPAVVQAVEASGYTEPTEIQAQIIPEMLAGRDVLAQSQTGSGKTAAFALPILSQLDPAARRPRVLVLAPTRELANQVARSFETYASRLPGTKVLAIYGGADYDTQFRKLKRGVQVVVGTPGRIIDHINRGTLDLSEIDTLVLDEADEMLNMGFLEDVEFVLEKTPKGRRVALFSATLPTPIRKIAKRYLQDPARITVKAKTMTAESIRQRAVFVAPRDKTDALIRFLEAEETDGVIVFTRTKDATVTLAEALNRVGYMAVALNGDLPQKTRERTIENLKKGRLDILVATDVAARGLDVQRISHVFNYDLPEGSESYIHRVGRTGRAGRKGEALIFLTRTQRRKLGLIENATKQSIEVVRIPEISAINDMRVKKFKQKIDRTIQDADLGFFQKLLAQYAEESGTPMEQIAAAVAHIGQRDQPFLMQENRKQRNKDRDRPDQDGKSSRGRKSFGPVEHGMNRYRIAVGRRDGVRPGNIVGAVANEAGINGDYIGPIRIFESYSTIDLPEGLPEDVRDVLHNAWVSGRQLRLRLADDDGPRNSRSSYGKQRHGKRNKNSNFSRGPKRGDFKSKRKKNRSHS